MRSVGLSVGLPVMEGQRSYGQTDNALAYLGKKTVKQGWSAHFSHNSVFEIGVGGGRRAVVEEISASGETLRYRETHGDVQIGVNCGVKASFGAMISQGRGEAIDKNGMVTGTVKTKRRLLSFTGGLDLKIFKILRDYSHKIKQQSIKQGLLKNTKLETESIVRTIFSAFLAFFGFFFSYSKISMKKIRFSQTKLSKTERVFHDAEMRWIETSKEEIYRLKRDVQDKVVELFKTYTENKSKILKILQNKSNYDKIKEQDYFLSRKNSSIRFGTGKTNFSPVNFNIYIDHSVKREGIAHSSNKSAVREMVQQEKNTAQLVTSERIDLEKSRKNQPQKHLAQKIPSLPLDFTASRGRFSPRNKAA